MTLKANWFQTNVSPLVDARDERRLLRALRPTGGVVQPSDFAVTPVGAGTTLAVNVAACVQGGGAVIPGLDTHQGAYFAYNDAALQVPIAVADPTNPRIDTVILRIYDDEATPGSGFAVAVELARGTPNANPVTPVLPRDCIPLADVRVNAAATGIGAGNITDRRVAIHGGLPRGVVVSGPSANPANGGQLPLNNVVSGPVSWLAANIVTIPVGAGGLYLVTLDVAVGGGTTVANNAAEIRNAANVGLGMQTGIANATPTSVVMHLTGAWIRQWPDGQTFQVRTLSNPPGSLTVGQLGLVRLGDALLTTPGALQQPAPPQDTPPPDAPPEAAPKLA